jgi:hypothetical protein
VFACRTFLRLDRQSTAYRVSFVLTKVFDVSPISMKKVIFKANAHTSKFFSLRLMFVTGSGRNMGYQKPSVWIEDDSVHIILPDLRPIPI